MDSGNSGSLQSSSGGDDDFDSRGGAGGGVDDSPLSALLRPTPSPSSAAAFSLHGSALYGLQDFTSAPHQQHQQQQQAPWTSSQFMAGAASSSQRAAPADAGAHHQAPDPSSAAAAATAPAPPRGSRKRARASRRAPTTVLTTDTSNFRAMVQEFTGIPNPPFGAGAGVPGAPFGTRFDHIFSASSSAALRSAADPASSLPPYLLRPFAQKLHTAPAPGPSPFASFTSPSSSTSSIGGPNTNANATAAAATAASAGHDFQLPSSALLRMQQQDQSSSYLSFQNLLGSAQPTSQQHMFGGMSQSHGPPRMHEQSPSQLLSGGGVGFTQGHGGMMVSEAMHMHQHHQQRQRDDVHQGGDELSGLVRAGASGSSCKLNYTSHAGASSSSAAASTDVPPDGASRPGRGEGLDPWLCTSE